jgi:hypothetical protein
MLRNGGCLRPKKALLALGILSRNNVYFDPAISLSPFSCLVRGNREALAESDRRYARIIHLFRNKVVLDRVSSTVRQLLVILLGAPAVGISLYDKL